MKFKLIYSMLILGISVTALQGQVDNTPPRPDRPDVPRVDDEDRAAFREAREALMEARRELRDSRREAVAALGDDATQEAIEAAIAAWKEENQTAVDELREEAKALHEAFKESRPDRPGFEMTEEMRAEIAARREEFKAKAEELKAAHDDLKEQLSDPELTQEQREELIRAFREENKDLHREIKDLRRSNRVRG